MTDNIFNTNKKILITSLLLFVFNFLLKIYGISTYEIALDEPFSIYYAQMDLHSIFNICSGGNNTPFHFILLHFWIKMFGMSAFSVRFLSVLFSSSAVVVVYLTGRKFFSYQTGIFAALIFSLSQFHVYFAHEARVYPMFVFLTALSLYFNLSAVTYPQKKGAFVWLFIANLLLIYAHYFGFFVIATEMVCLFFIPNFRSIYKKLLIVFILLALCYLPNIIIFYQRFASTIQQGTWVKTPQFSELYGNLNRFLNSRYVMLVLIICVLLNLGLNLKKRQFTNKVIGFKKNIPSRIIIIWFLFPYLSMFLLSYRVPMFLDRYIIYISLSFYILIAMFLGKFTANPSVKMISFFAILIVMMWNLSLTPDNKRRVSQVVETVNELKAKDKNTLIIISPEYAYMEFTYHYNINYFKDYKNTISLLNKDNIYPLRDLSEFDKSKLKNRKVVYLDCGSQFAFGKNPILNELKASHKKDTTLYVYEIYAFHCFDTIKQ